MSVQTVARREAIRSTLERSSVRMTVLELREALREHPAVAYLADPGQAIYEALLGMESAGLVDRVRRDSGYVSGSGADEWGLR